MHIGEATPSNATKNAILILYFSPFIFEKMLVILTEANTDIKEPAITPVIQ